MSQNRHSLKVEKLRESLRRMYLPTFTSRHQRIARSVIQPGVREKTILM